MSTIDATISACILARNEEGQIEEALRSLKPWVDQIIVIDNESEDRTAEIARRYADVVLTAPRTANFDALRNLARDVATGQWVFVLDADERVPPRLGKALRLLVQERGAEFEALFIPFKHYFCGQWIQHSGWWPGYTRPQLLKRGCFEYNPRVHSGARVSGRSLYFPADDPELAIIHYSYLNLRHYLTKANGYTDAEAEHLRTDGGSHAWQAQLANFVIDLQIYYERGRGDLDGMHGFVLAFMAGTYRFLARAKLWDLRRQRGELLGSDPVPSSVREMLEFMARVAQEGPAGWLEDGQYPRKPAVNLVPREWCAPPEDAVISMVKGTSRERSGITACIVARNEERRIGGALRSVQGWTDRIIVVDNESDDRTAEIAGRYADVLLTAPRAAHLEAVRLQVADAIADAAFATGEWLFLLDADERVSPRLGELLRRLVREHGDELDAIAVPFKNQFYGKWMQSGAWWPGDAGLRLLKKGTFRYDERIHSGVIVDGRVLYLPADDPAYAVDHSPYEEIRQYLDKLNAYTDAEAESFHAAGVHPSWQAMLGHFVHDWVVHYDQGRASIDGMHGFVQAFLCSLYRFVSHAKLWDLRRQQGERIGQDPVPANVAEMLQFMLRVAQEVPAQGLAAIREAQPPPALRDAHGRAGTAVPVAATVPLLWHGPLLDPSGYADEARQFVLGLLEAGESLALAPEPWGGDAGLPIEIRRRFDERTVPADTPCELYVSHTLPKLQAPSPHARFNIARTMFETDRLPAGWSRS
jgi:glycosyltransferase involved in cell wall biosynthesis